MDKKDAIRQLSATPNPDFDINKSPLLREEFVHVVNVAGKHPVEVHIPFEWVSLNPAGEIVFNEEGTKTLREVEELVFRQ